MLQPIMTSRSLSFVMLLAACACSSSSPGGDGAGGTNGDGSGGAAGGTGGEGGSAGGGDGGLCPPGFAGSSCDACAANRFGESCAPCPCVNGTCDDGRTGSGACSCDGNWAGDACSTCSPGWSGPGCDACADGFHPSGSDCIVDEPTACQAGSASADHYVDPVFGFDDPNYGGGAGACAYRSVAYAVSQATGKIFLSGGTHPLTTTISLSAGQELQCDAENPGVLSGQPLYLTSHVMLRMISNTALRNCVLRGEGTVPGYCIQTDGAATIEGTQIDQCGGASLRAFGTGLSVVGNEFLSSGTSVFFQSGGSADISDNVFHGGPTNVSCNTATTVTGTGNSRPGASVTCSALCGCPEGFAM